ncbi:hypothetical protein ACWD7F_15225 [Streptomyces sp. NPDC005122]
MDIPDWFEWILLGLTIFQTVALVPVTHRLRGPDSAVRSKARLDLLETVGGLLFFGGMLLGSAVAEPWSWLALLGYALMSAVYAVKGVQRLRARRRPTA